MSAAQPAKSPGTPPGGDDPDAAAAHPGQGGGGQLRSQVLSLLYQAVRRGEMTRKDAERQLEYVRGLRIRLHGDRVLQDVAWKAAVLPGMLHSDLPVPLPGRRARQRRADHRDRIRPPRQDADRQQHMGAPAPCANRPARPQPPPVPALTADHPRPGMPPPAQPLTANRALQPPR
jgi:hypothetical protein